MSKVKLNLIAAASENMGIGVNGTLPWRLKKEMAYFTSMTTKTSDPNKKNAVIMGRVSWDCIPDKFRPLVNRVNIVLTRNVDELKKKVPEGVVVVSGLEGAVQYVDSREDIENAWVIGGAAVYKLALAHPNMCRVYLTEIQKHYECDTFFPKLDLTRFKTVQPDDVPAEKQEENGIQYYFRVYEKV
ncbi:hypothetical protein O0L34_g13220 [Tuta absoluta]|nr:hypothetical protein O0L34_g13220 [Tuta absoluta]